MVPSSKPSDAPSSKPTESPTPESITQPLVDYGHSPNELLGPCEGDCDNDDECENGLECFQRNGFTSVPGCRGAGLKDYDYCVSMVRTYCYVISFF